MRNSSPGIRRPSSCSRCAARWARTRPSRSIRSPIPFRRCPTSRRSPRPARELKAARPASVLAAARRRHRRLARRRQDAWDAFPNTGAGKMDAETAPLAAGAAAITNVQLADRRARSTGWKPRRTARRIAAIDYRQNGERRRSAPKLVDPVAPARSIRPSCCCARADDGNRRPRQPLRPGRPQFHEPQLLGACWRSIRAARNDSVYQKTLVLNDYYLVRRQGRPAARQCPAARARSTAPILKANVRSVPEIRARPAWPAMPSTGT